MDIDLDVRIVLINVRAFVVLVREVVTDGVFYTQRCEIQASKRE